MLKGYKILYNKIQTIITNNNIKITGIKNKKEFKTKKKKELIFKNGNKNLFTKNKHNENNINNDFKENFIININENQTENPPRKRKSKNLRKTKIDNFISKSSSNILIKKKLNNSNILNKKMTKKNTKKINIINNYNDYEINNLPYNEALEIDRRTYVLCYLSLLKTKHLLIFSFYTNNDYNSKSIKISLFFFSFALHYTVNALFFSDSTMHQIYEDKGYFNFIYQIP